MFLDKILGLVGIKSVSIFWTKSFSETGFTQMPTKDVFRLLDAIHLSFNRPDLIPEGGVTHCNQYVAQVCEIYGFSGFNGLVANDMVDYIAGSQNWSEVPIDRCQDLANAGALIIAGFKENPHGHVNVICPGKPKTSGRWGTVPSCANVGKDLFIGKGVNWAFHDFPKFYAWRSSL